MQPTTMREFVFNLGGADSIIGFTADGQLYSKVMFMKRSVNINAISSITLKKAMLSSNIQLDVRINEKGREKMFYSVQFDVTDPQGKSLIEELKMRLGKNVKWNDNRPGTENENVVPAVQNNTRSTPLNATASATTQRSFDLQYMLFKQFAGFSRGAQIGIGFSLLTIMTLGLALPVMIYVLAAGCYRVYTDENGITIKKLFAKTVAWNTIQSVRIIRYNIAIQNYGTTVDTKHLLRYEMMLLNGKKINFTMRTAESKNFVQLLIVRQKTDPSIAEIFI